MNCKSSESRLVWNILNSYPTNSLKEYLEYESAHCTEQTDHKLKINNTSDHDSTETSTFEIEIDIGDGRSEVILVNSKTDIDAKANKFCNKFGLGVQVKQLLAESIRQKYEQEKEEAINEQIKKEIQTAREIYCNAHAQQVLLTRDDPRPIRPKNSFDSNMLKENMFQTIDSRNMSKVSHNYYSKAKKFSLGDTGISNKQNQFAINKVSQQICERLGKDNILQYRRKRSIQKKQKLLKEREIKEEQKMKECPFRPQINGISKKVDEQLLNSKVREEKKVERYLLLYENYKQQQQKKEQDRHNFMVQMPFKPNINAISQRIVENKRDKSTIQDHHLPQSPKKSHLNCSQDQPFRSVPPRKPKIPNRNVENLPIGQYLYNKAMQKSKSKATLQSKTQIKAINHSDYLVSILKQKRFNEIFTDLTQPPHQVLSSRDINLSQLIFKTGIYRYFQPIFNQMIEFDIALSRSEFTDASLSLFKSLSPEEKHQIIFKKQKILSGVTDKLNHSLVNSKSRQILRKIGYERPDLYTRGLNHMKTVKERVEQNKEEQARQQLKICTFKPVLNPNTPAIH